MTTPSANQTKIIFTAIACFYLVGCGVSAPALPEREAKVQTVDRYVYTPDVVGGGSSNTGGGSSNVDTSGSSDSFTVTQMIYRVSSPGGFHQLDTDPSKFPGWGVDGAVYSAFVGARGGSRAEIFKCQRTTITGETTFFATSDPNCEGLSTVGRTSIYFLEKAPSQYASKPVHRCYSMQRDDHLITMFKDECTNNGYAYESVLGYAP